MEVAKIQENYFEDSKMRNNEENMIAIHMLDEEKLQKAIQREALICPSIAYTTKECCLNNSSYGNICILFDEKDIDPQLNQNTVLYSSDGYTPVIRTYTDEKITDNLPTEEIVDFLKKQRTNELLFVQNTDEKVCKSNAKEPISLNQAKEEAFRLVSLSKFEDLEKYKNSVIDVVENFLDKNFKGWDWSDTEKKHLRNTPFLEANSIPPRVYTALAAAIRASAENGDKYLAVKETCEKYGLKVNKRQVVNIVNLQHTLRQMPTPYFEAKLYEAFPITKVKGVVLPQDIDKDIASYLSKNNVPFIVNSWALDYKEALLSFDNALSKSEAKNISSILPLLNSNTRLAIADSIEYYKGLPENEYKSVCNNLIHDANPDIRKTMVRQGFIEGLENDPSPVVREAVEEQRKMHDFSSKRETRDKGIDI